MTASTSAYRSPDLTTISFAVGILLFFLPFMEIKCGGTTLAQMSGLNMVTGSSPKMNSDFENMARGFDKNDGTSVITKKEKQGKSYAFAIVALALGAGGVVVSILRKGKDQTIKMILGIAGALSLIALMVQVKADVGDALQSENAGSSDFSSMMKVSVHFTAWFFLSVLAYLSAAFFSYQQKQKIAKGDIPPAHAPQLNIENPGDQSEFPAAPTGEKDLG